MKTNDTQNHFKLNKQGHVIPRNNKFLSNDLAEEGTVQKHIADIRLNYVIITRNVINKTLKLY